MKAERRSRTEEENAAMSEKRTRVAPVSSLLHRSYINYPFTTDGTALPANLPDTEASVFRSLNELLNATWR